MTNVIVNETKTTVETTSDLIGILQAQVDQRNEELDSLNKRKEQTLDSMIAIKQMVKNREHLQIAVVDKTIMDKYDSLGDSVDSLNVEIGKAYEMIDLLESDILILSGDS